MTIFTNIDGWFKCYTNDIIYAELNIFSQIIWCSKSQLWNYLTFFDCG